MTRVAALDCGTNSLRLLIADVEPNGQLRDVRREMRIVRLGQGVDRSGRLASEALERTRVALAEYAKEIEVNDVARVRMVATSAVRDATNRDEFEHVVQSAIGVAPDVVSGEEEARLSFAGAVSVPAIAGHGAVLLTDIGGGSTELILGQAASARVQSAVSMDVGSVRLTERHFASDPPSAGQIAAATADVEAALDGAERLVSLDTGAVLVGVAGTVTTLAGMVLGLDRYESAQIHGASIDAIALDATIEDLLSRTHDERAAIGVLHPGRVDVIAAGAIVLRTIVRRVRARAVVVSEHDILDGIALTLR